MKKFFLFILIGGVTGLIIWGVLLFLKKRKDNKEVGPVEDTNFITASGQTPLPNTPCVNGQTARLNTVGPFASQANEWMKGKVIDKFGPIYTRDLLTRVFSPEGYNIGKVSVTTIGARGTAKRATFDNVEKFGRKWRDATVDRFDVLSINVLQALTGNVEINSCQLTAMQII